MNMSLGLRDTEQPASDNANYDAAAEEVPGLLRGNARKATPVN